MTKIQQFINSGLQSLAVPTDTSLLYVVSYNPILIILSVLISILASYAALSASARIETQIDNVSKLVWILVSAVTLGIGVWGMHFIGMLALHLPCSIHYDPVTTLASMIPGILAGGVALGVVWHHGTKHLSPLVGSILLGAGIGIMHYTGMAAMRLEGFVRYTPSLFALSIVVAVALSYLALRIKNVLKRSNLLVAVIMGGAISGMHYTAMFAAYFVRDDAALVPPSTFSANTLAIIVAITTAFLALSVLTLVAVLRGWEMTKQQVTLAAAHAAAVHAAQTKSAFLSHMSHEIRTPMNGVLGMLDILKDTEMSREQCDLVETATNSAEALLEIINDILDLSKLEAGKIEIEYIKFDLPSLVEEVCLLQAGRAYAKGLELNCFLPVDFPVYWEGDPTRIRQVLTNLIGNAVKFTEHGEVSVKVIVLPSLESAVSLRFEVMDTGIGITPETKERLFQAFVQADSSTSRRFGGTGLGLSISKNLVELMEGLIGVESEAGKGACFWFSLPLKPVKQNLTQPPIFDLSGKRMLLVDDNSTNRAILEHYLKHWGVAVHSVDNAQAGLAALIVAAQNADPFDMLLSDLHMPGMDGLALAQAIGKIPSIADTPRLLLSSGGLMSEAERKALGFAQSLLKPVRQAQLFDAIVSALQLSTQLPDTMDRRVINQDKDAFPDYSGKKVLIAEDNQVNQKVVLALLAKFQLKPDLAENGQAALELLAKHSYDLVLMDCQMPVMDGYEATRLLREREMSIADTSRTPVVALTAHATTEARETCLTAGMDDYLSKPFNRTALKEMLTRWLGSASTSEMALQQAKTAINVALPEACWDEAVMLELLEGDEDLLIELIELFIESVPARLDELNGALAKDDLQGVVSVAHALMGMTGQFYAETAKTCAAQLEYSARHAQGTDMALLSVKLTEAITHLVKALQQRKRVNP